MKSYKEFNEVIKNKNIIYVPIVSCINRDTGEYKLNCDGNVNRFITTFTYANSFKHLTIFLPFKHELGSSSLTDSWASNYNIELIYTDNWGIHAGEQRNNDNVVKGMFDDILKEINEDDIIVFESQKLGKMMIENINNDLIFFNPVSKTTKTRIFLEGYDEINNYIIEHCLYTLVSSPDQISFYNKLGYNNKLIYIPKLIDRDIDCFNYIKDNHIINFLEEHNNDLIYYLPYRLTDEGYNFNKVIEFIKANSNKNYIILYSDPNDSHILNTLNINTDKFIKVNSSRNTYYTIIDYSNNIIIPYFEDLDFINHAAIHEFINDKSKCIVYVNSNLNNPYDIFSCDRIKQVEI